MQLSTSKKRLAGEMEQEVRVLVDEPKDPSSIPRTRKVEGKNKLPQAVL